MPQDTLTTLRTLEKGQRIQMSKVLQKLKAYYYRANRFSRGTLEIIRLTIWNFSINRGAEASASLSYYALFSLFPLLLVLISVSGYILKSQETYESIVQMVLMALPNSQVLIERNLQEILDRRGAIGLIGLIGAAWSASGFFNTLVRNINYPWKGIKPRNVIRTRLMALGMVGAVAILMVLSLASTTFVNVMRIWDALMIDGVPLNKTEVWHYLSFFVPWIFTFLMFFGLYNWLPNTKVAWRAAVWGALWSALAWEAAKRIFAFYVSSGLMRYEIIYGSLGTVLALMMWIYISCTITLLGANLTATIDQLPVDTPKDEKVELL